VEAAKVFRILLKNLEPAVSLCRLTPEGWGYLGLFFVNKEEERNKLK
jgi:hypothetical protein